MAANSEEITLETKRCIFVDDHIYFSNYYLKSKISEVTGRVNKIKFDTTEFMNKTMIQDVNKKQLSNQLSNQLEITFSNQSNLNESLYSKVNISNKSIEITVAETDILQLKIENKSIFKDNEQIKQFLKYDGWWCPAAERIEFDNRVQPASTDEMPSAPSQTAVPAPQPAATGSQTAATGSQPAATGSQPATASAGWFGWVPGLGQPSAPQPAQPSGPQQTIGGTKQTRSTRNHKNRKSKKN
jgi:hypothetical protein